jgi:hypothetical protein
VGRECAGTYTDGANPVDYQVGERVDGWRDGLDRWLIASCGVSLVLGPPAAAV